MASTVYETEICVGDLKVVGRDYTLQFRREQSFGKQRTIEGFG